MEQEKEFFAAVLRLAKPHAPNDREPNTAEREAAIAALEEAQIEQTCDCGTCPTYNLLYPGEPIDQDLPRTYLSVGTQDGETLLLTHLTDGRLTTLEVAPTGNKPVAALPATDHLTP
ncbi:hypothetical protein E4U03_09130 [Rothia nasimurium]|uniref:Uncharacterized protein n=1 Tax=Rothia nasimurium TaxID=85336 RepID=A0A4Y9F399_9MICC|nr:hypothetical protein [Rothia nasimurium]MBF0808765.1 hypothetical protein [Rothia nasimurium]TFU21393.1 hypothetical protein E4U03_09130 [Rothia nasimurium]